MSENPPASDRNRAELLRQLPAFGFVPPSDWLDSPRDDALDDDVEAFAAKFWTLPLVVRRAEWQALMDRAKAHLRSAARLRRLQPGIDIEADCPTPRESGRALVRALQELFVLKPPDKMPRRSAIARAALEQRVEWQGVALALRRAHPAVFALDPLAEQLTVEAEADAEFRKRSWLHALVASQVPDDTTRIGDGVRIATDSGFSRDDIIRRIRIAFAVTFGSALVISVMVILSGERPRLELTRFAQPPSWGLQPVPIVPPRR